MNVAIRFSLGSPRRSLSSLSKEGELTPKTVKTSKSIRVTCARTAGSYTFAALLNRRSPRAAFSASRQPIRFQ
jgi:hypothetical protein